MQRCLDCLSPPASSAPKPKLLDQVRQAIRLRHYSIRTEEANVNWVRRFIRVHNKRYTNVMGQELLGHHDVWTTMMLYACAETRGKGMRSPLDLV